jgi:YHS domain-containing protein
MRRGLSALFFLSGMLALLLFQQPAFAYCAQTSQFFISDCGCEQEVESKRPRCQKEQPSDQLDVDDLGWFDLAVEVPTMLCSTAAVSQKEDKTTAGDPPAEILKVAGDYPRDVYVVTGEKLGSMGEPFVITHEGTEVRFCCDSCVPKFKKDPSKYLAKLKK